MERRKVIRQGKGTLTMSLPSSWIRQTRLRPGDDLLVDQRGQHLLVSPIMMQKEERAVEVDLRGFEQYFVYAVIENLYIRGEDEIRLRYDSEEAFNAISRIVRLLIGFEIVEHRKGWCVIKEIAKAEKDDFDVLLRRVFLLLISNAEDGIEAFRNRDLKELSCLAKRDRNVNVLVSYCMRVLNKHEHSMMKDTKHLYALLILLENLGDEYARLYKEVTALNSTTIDIAAKTAALIREFYELYYRFDKGRASKLKLNRDRMKKSISNAIENARKKDDILALQHFRTVGDAIVNIEKFHLATQMLE